METNNRFGFIPTPTAPAPNNPMVIYEVNIEKQADEHKITTSLWENTIIIATQERVVPDFPEHVDMTSAYLAAMTARLSRLSHDSQKVEPIIDMSSVIRFVAQTIYQFLVPDAEIEELWRQFVDHTSVSEQHGILLISGSGVTTWPVETLAHWRSPEKDCHWAVVKSATRIEDPSQWFGKPLASTLVFVYGSKRYSGGPADRSEDLDYVSELSKVLGVLYPDGIPQTYDEISLAVQMGTEFQIGTGSKVVIIGQGMPLGRVSERVSEIPESYILVYSGHGVRTNDWCDGTMIVPRDNSTISVTSDNAVTHANFGQAVQAHPPDVLIFNCCEPIRAIDPHAGGLSLSHWKSVEQTYAENRVNGGLSIVFGSRAPIRDEHGIAVATSITEQFLHGTSVVDLLLGLSFPKHPSAGPIELLTRHKMFRDEVIGTILALW